MSNFCTDIHTYIHTYAYMYIYIYIYISNCPKKIRWTVEPGTFGPIGNSAPSSITASRIKFLQARRDARTQRFNISKSCLRNPWVVPVLLNSKHFQSRKIEIQIIQKRKVENFQQSSIVEGTTVGA